MVLQVLNRLRGEGWEYDRVDPAPCTPLATLRGYLEGLMDGVVEPSDQTWARLHGETGRLQRLVDDLQELSRAADATVHLGAVPDRGLRIGHLQERAGHDARDNQKDGGRHHQLDQREARLSTGGSRHLELRRLQRHHGRAWKNRARNRIAHGARHRDLFDAARWIRDLPDALIEPVGWRGNAARCQQVALLIEPVNIERHRSVGVHAAANGR